MAEAMSRPAPSPAERMDVFLTEQELEHRLVSSCGECIDDDPCQNCVVLLAHDAALRARAEKAEEAKDALYESFKELTAMDQHSAFRAGAAEARVKTLYALLVEWADEVHIHTDEPCDVGPSCLMCRTAAALKATP